MKKYILIAGVNGAGKSTLFQTLESVEIAKERIAYRVAHGGHYIPDEDVERRYYEGFRRLAYLIPLCETVILYDNTDYFRRFAVYRDGNLLSLLEPSPAWFQNLFPK